MPALRVSAEHAPMTPASAADAALNRFVHKLWTNADPLWLTHTVDRHHYVNVYVSCVQANRGVVGALEDYARKVVGSVEGDYELRRFDWSFWLVSEKPVTNKVWRQTHDGSVNQGLLHLGVSPTSARIWVLTRAQMNEKAFGLSRFWLRAAGRARP